MSTDTPSPVNRKIGFVEFLVLAAALMACQALAIDAMLPALPTIAAAFNVDNENHAQWVVTAYVAGMGCGQLFWGVLSDRFGRRPVLLTGLSLYVLAALLAGYSNSFTGLLGWRYVHGLAAACVVVSRSVIRDLYSGRQMARIMSLTFIVFIMVPIMAPTIGQGILQLAPWRYLFVLFSVYGATVWTWVLLRLPETLHPEYRLTLTVTHMAQSARRVVNDRASVFYTLSVAVIFGSMIGYIGMVQQIFAGVFHRPGLMPTMFAVCAGSMGVTSFINSRIVERIGMRRVSQTGLLLFITLSSTHALIAALGMETLTTFVMLQAATMSCMGLMVANFGTMAMESMASVAGIAASFQGFVSTTGGALVGALIGRQFNNSTVPLATGAALCGLLAFSFVMIAERGRLFRPHHSAG